MRKAKRSSRSPAIAKERGEAVQYASEVNGAGWLDASTLCERDPRGRAWVTAERIARLDSKLQSLATAEIFHPKDTWQHSGKGVLSDRAAQEKIKQLESEAAEEAKRREVEARLVKEGCKLLNALEQREACKYGGEINGAGWLDGSQQCERDPKGRTWAKLLKGVAGVTTYAMTKRVWEGGQYEIKGVPVFKREEANAALKKLGLWEAEGSAKEKEKLQQRREREKRKQEEAQMLADVASLVEKASVQEPRRVRAVLLSVVSAFLHTNGYGANLKFVAERRSIDTRACHEHEVR